VSPDLSLQSRSPNCFQGLGGAKKGWIWLKIYLKLYCKELRFEVCTMGNVYIPHLLTQVIMAKRGLLGISVPKDEELKLEQLASRVKLSKSELARAMLRAGQLVYKENPQLVLTFVPTSRTID